MLLVRVKTLFTHLLILLVTGSPLFSQNKEYEDTTLKKSDKLTDNDQDAIMYELEKELKEEGLEGWYYSITACRIHDYYYHKGNSNFDCEKVNLYVDKYIQSGDILKHKDLTVVDYTILITVQFLNGKSKNYDKQLEYLDILHQALKDKKPNIRKYPSIFKVLFMMHETYLGLRDYLKALDVILLLAEQQNEILGENSFEYLISLNKLAGTYSELGNYNKALETNIHEATKRKELQGENHPEYLMCLNNLAKAYSNLGDYQNALIILTEVSVKQKNLLGKNHPIYYKSVMSLAKAYSYLEEYKTAIELTSNVAEKRKELLGDEHPEYLMSLNNLANIYSQMGDYTKALEILLNVCEKQKILLNENHPSYLATFNYLAITYYDLGKYIKSLDIATKLALKSKELWGENHPDYLMVLNNIALNYTELQEYEEALKIDTELKDKRKRLLGQNHPDYLTSLINLAVTEFYIGQLDSSAVHYSEYYNRTKHRIITFFSSLPESQRRLILNKHSFSFEYVPFFIGQNKPKYSGEIYNASLFIKGLLLNATLDFEELIQEEGSPEVIAKFDKLKNLKLQAQKLEDLPINERYQSLDSLQNIIHSKEMELVRVSSEYGEYTSNLKISWKDVQSKLKKNEIAIEFVEYPTLSDTVKYAALVLRKNWSAPKMISLFNKGELQKWLNNSPDSLYSNGTIGKNIKELIWNPLELYIEKNEKVYFSASGLLYKVAIENLAINDSTSLGDYYSLYRLSSTKELVTHKSKTVNRKAVLYGGLNYTMADDIMLTESQKYSSAETLYALRTYMQDNSLRSGFDYLPATLQEVKDITQLMDNTYQVDKYIGNSGNEESFKSLSGKNIGVLHIATHGFFLPKKSNRKRRFKRELYGFQSNVSLKNDPMQRSGLILAGGNKAWHGNRVPEGLEDGILTAKEISMLDFKSTNLVVLSACETGLGDISSEGVFGLQRAFKQAGVQTLIMALWKIDDQASRYFMSQFYKGLLDGMNRRKAFNSAKNCCRIKFKEPRYWASFIMLD